ncbi:hypothetical protein [Methylomonas sp. ZR1]|uniref:hypothetical protein n=1 Tax=Methylomonas sp. ZR1 TaxID=1797072 RepID=UPI001491922E|nr:hypothetical protein [Methylomonas sp. ZR1]NOV31174.1 hypothetical protein [Methylomonas sp. ZR1]
MKHLSMTIILLTNLGGCTTSSRYTQPLAVADPAPTPKPLSTTSLYPSTATEKTGPVNVYLIPLNDFSEDIAAQIGMNFSKEFGLRVKGTVAMGTQGLMPMPGTQQFAAEDIFEHAKTVMQRLPEADSSTYFIFLTNRDINSRARNFRFQFSFHDKVCRCSVVSAARMHPEPENSPGSRQYLESRFVKMTKRAIGQMVLGWERSSDIKDLMYSPIMSLDDIDHLGNRHPAIPKK